MSSAVDWLGTVLAGGSTLDDWARLSASGKASSGRGSVHFVPAPRIGPDQSTHWVVRRYRRGGAVAGMLVDRYLSRGMPRPLRELWASVEARSRNVLTPAVVAGAVYSSGLFYRADLVTEAVPGATELADAAFREEPSGTENVLRAAGSLVRDLGTARLLHPDLNAHNILVTATDPVAAWVIDLDRARTLPKGAPQTNRAMEARLVRSLRKLERESGRSLSKSQWAALRAGFGAGT